MPRGKKIALVVVVVLAGIALALAIIVPRLVDVDRYRPEVVARIEQQTGRSASISRLTLRLVPLSIRVDGFSLGNPPDFPAGALVRVERIDADLDWHALLGRQVAITSLNFSQPTVTLLSTPDDRWNYASPAAPRPRLAGVAFAESSLPMTLGVIAKVTLQSGRVTVERLAPGGALETTVDAEGVSGTLEQVNLSAFGLAGGSGSRPANGNAPRRASNVVMAAPLPPAFPSEPLAAQGSVEIATLRSQGFEIDKLRSNLALYRHRVSLTGLNFDLYGGHSQGNLTFDFSGPRPCYETTLDMSGVNMASLLAAFPSARGKMTGTLEGHFNLTGATVESTDPLAGKQGTGQVMVRNGLLPTLQLNRNLIELMKDAGVRAALEGDPSAFSSISADLKITGGRILSRKVSIAANGVDLDATGSLALAGAGELSYDGVARIDVKQNTLSTLLGGLLGGKLSGGKLAFKFGIGGTLAQPRFSLKSNPLLGAPNSHAVPSVH